MDTKNSDTEPKLKKSHFDFRENRFKALNSRLQEITTEIDRIRTTGAIAPPGCWVVRYLVAGSGGGIADTKSGDRYPYYKLQAKQPIFENGQGKPCRYQHLGKAGCSDHVQALQSVSRRGQIEALEREKGGIEQALEDFSLDRSAI